MKPYRSERGTKMASWRLTLFGAALLSAGCSVEAQIESRPREWQVNRVPDVGPCAAYQIVAPTLWDRVALVCPDSVRAVWESAR